MDAKLSGMETVLKALADTTRLRILSLLVAGEVCVCHIHQSLRVPQPTASRHLAYLRRTGLVQTRRQRQWVYYRLAEPQDEVLQTLLSCVRHCLTHLSTTGRDRHRLGQRTGCCLAVEQQPTVTCCGTGRQDLTAKSPSGA